MSKRAEFRRQQKQNMNKKKTYTLTQEQINQIKHEMYKQMYKEIYQEVHDKIYKKAVDVSFGLMMYIPANVLSANNWKKTADKRIPEFLDNCLDLYGSIDNNVTKYTDIISEVEKFTGKRIDIIKKLEQLK